MPKVKISDFSTTAGNNTDINSINIAEGCAPSGINDAIRTLMAQLKDWQSGAVAQDNTFNGVVGALAQNPVRMYDTDSSNYVALRAPGTVSSNVTWTLPGTDGTANQVLKTDGAGVLGWVTGASGDVTTTGTQTLTNKTINGSSNTITNVSLATGVTGTLPVANGGTGATALTANNVLLGNGTSALQVVAPGSNGNVLTSNGTTWTSAAPAGGGAWTLISTVTANNSATISFTGLNSTYDVYVITIARLVPQSGWDLEMKVSTDGGSTYSSSDYSYITTVLYDTSTSHTYYKTQSGGNFDLTGDSIATTSTEGCSGVIYLFKPSASANFQCAWDLVHSGTSFTTNHANGAGRWKTTNDVDAVRLYMASGNVVSGVFRLYGIKNS